MELDEFQREGRVVLDAIDQGNLGDAIALVRALAVRVSADPLKLTSLSQTTLREIHQPRLALELAEAAIAAGPDRGVGYHARGSALEVLGRLQEAELAFLAAAEREPRYESWLAAGQLARRQGLALPPAAPGDPDAEAVGCWERALRCYRRAAETAEGAADRAEATAWVAHALNDLRRHGEAIAVLESLPEEPDLPQDVRLQVEVAWALGLGWSGELDRALEHAERAIAIEPPGGTAFALEMRARIHAAHGRPRAAAADMIARAERVAGDPHLQAHCLYGAARALDEAGDTREAFDRISQALRVLESNALEAPPAVRDLRRDLLARRG